MEREVKQKIGEPVKVLASFGKNKIRIHFFNWQDRLYRVESMNLFHIAQDGERKTYQFAVSAQPNGERSRTAGNAYQLSFNPITLVWQLEDVVGV